MALELCFVLSAVAVIVVAAFLNFKFSFIILQSGLSVTMAMLKDWLTLVKINVKC